ncbi:oxidoreductase [Burkholderia sp. Bp9012]|uniref:PDR/VanB family oxidoreductase n=1 Tax=Burkholderia sp. Bp9012 TaxID=2184562 RepID=UPI000F5B38D0|nr:PDR/VanB family oxidoreductase [Burkholderia sp. Bp9012]RQR85353.1 oxidoreductase [Burkholderia sp. Bp9012]
MRTIPVRVAAKTRETDDVVRLELEATNAFALPTFDAGAHINITIRPGLARAYSLCNAPGDGDRYMIAVQRARTSRGGSATLCEQTEVGDTILISEPLNTVRLVDAKRTLLFAYGIGIAPVLSMVATLARRDTSFEIHYCARSVRHAPFLPFLRAAAYAQSVRTYFGNDGDGPWFDATSALGMPDGDKHAYACGPAHFTAHVVQAAAAAGWNVSHVHPEHFSQDNTERLRNREFDVKIASTGHVYRVPADLSVCAALARHDVRIPTSCGDGVCGTCTTKILEGTVEHRDFYLTSRERAMNALFTPCCSRAVTDLLVLDL